MSRVGSHPRGNPARGTARATERAGARSRDRPGPFRIAVPAYFHPLRSAAEWERLAQPTRCACLPVDAAADRGAELVVVNPASGFSDDPAYPRACAALRGAVPTVAGYIDTGYAERRPASVFAEAEAYAARCGLSAVFIDQVTSDRAGLRYYRRLAEGLRARGLGPVVLNPGVAPDPGYLAVADVVVTFEGPWSAYAERPADRPAGPAHTWHLVHSTPVGETAAAVERIRWHRATFGYVTERPMPNPWDRLPAWWSAQPDTPKPEKWT